MAKRSKTAGKPPQRCVVNDRRGDLVSPCFGMLEAANEPYSRGLGLSLLVLTNLDTKAKRTVAMIRSGKHKKNGLLLNNCPFCGIRMARTPMSDIFADSEPHEVADQIAGMDLDAKPTREKRRK